MSLEAIAPRLAHALRTAEMYLVERGIDSRGVVGREVVLPEIRAALSEFDSIKKRGYEIEEASLTEYEQFVLQRR